MNKIFLLYGKFDENDAGTLIGAYSTVDKAEEAKRISSTNDIYTDYYILAEECDKNIIEKLPFKDATIGMIKNCKDSSEDWFVVKEIDTDEYLFIYREGGYDICGAGRDADFRLDGTINDDTGTERVRFLCKAKSFSEAQYVYKNPYSYREKNKILYLR